MEEITRIEKITAWNYLKCRAVDAQLYEIAAYYRDGERNQTKEAGISPHALDSVLPLFENHDKILNWIGENWNHIHDNFSDISTYKKW